MSDVKKEVLRLRTMLLSVGTAIALFSCAIILLLIDIHAAVVVDANNLQATMYTVAFAGIFGAIGILYPATIVLWDWYRGAGRSDSGGMTDAD